MNVQILFDLTCAASRRRKFVPPLSLHCDVLILMPVLKQHFHHIFFEENKDFFDGLRRKNERKRKREREI